MVWVRVGSRYELVRVRVGIRYELARYDLVRVRVDRYPSCRFCFAFEVMLLVSGVSCSDAALYLQLTAL